MTVLEREREVLLGCGDEDTNDDTDSDATDDITRQLTWSYNVNLLHGTSCMKNIIRPEIKSCLAMS